MLDMSKLEDEIVPRIPENLPPPTPTVDKIMGKFHDRWTQTADECVRRAEELEAAAKDLRERADKMLEARYLTDEIVGAVRFEIEARNRVQSLMFVNPT